MGAAMSDDLIGHCGCVGGALCPQHLIGHPVFGCPDDAIHVRPQTTAEQVAERTANVLAMVQAMGRASRRAVAWKASASKWRSKFIGCARARAADAAAAPVATDTKAISGRRLAALEQCARALRSLSDGFDCDCGRCADCEAVAALAALKALSPAAPAAEEARSTPAKHPPSYLAEANILASEFAIRAGRHLDQMMRDSVAMALATAHDAGEKRGHTIGYAAGREDLFREMERSVRGKVGGK
jgi:hypothetical protein